MVTPEYMPPEVLEIILSENKNLRAGMSSIQRLAQIAPISSTDVWSLGVILVEIITGIPIWLSYKCKIVKEKK